MPCASRHTCLSPTGGRVKQFGMSPSVLSDNIKKLMEASADLNTQAALGRRCGIDQRTVVRIINLEHSPTLEKIEAIATAYGLLPWQILVPGLDPKNPPVCELTQVEKGLYDKLRRLVTQLPPS